MTEFRRTRKKKDYYGRKIKTFCRTLKDTIVKLTRNPERITRVEGDRERNYRLKKCNLFFFHLE